MAPMVGKRGWVTCPVCGRKILSVLDSLTLASVPDSAPVKITCTRGHWTHVQG